MSSETDERRNTDEAADAEEREAPPFLQTWPRVYGALVAILVGYMGLFALLSRVGA